MRTSPITPTNPEEPVARSTVAAPVGVRPPPPPRAGSAGVTASTGPTPTAAPTTPTAQPTTPPVAPAASPTATVSGTSWWDDDADARKKKTQKDLDDNFLASVGCLWQKFESESGEKYKAVQLKLNGKPEDAITTSANTTEIKLLAEVTDHANKKTAVDIQLTLTKDPASNNVTMTCNAKDIPEALQYQLIAAQFLQLREKNMDSEEAKKVTIVEMSPSERGGSQKASTKFQGENGVALQLTAREEMMIQGHFAAGYTEITYNNQKIPKPVPVSVQHSSMAAAAASDGAADAGSASVSGSVGKAVAAPVAGSSAQQVPTRQTTQPNLAAQRSSVPFSGVLSPQTASNPANQIPSAQAEGVAVTPRPPGS